LLYWIYNYSALTIGTIFVAVFLLATYLAIFGFRSSLHGWFHRQGKSNDMVGFALSSYSVFYGLLIGLIAVAAYQNLTVVQDVVTREASSLSAMYNDLYGYPQPTRGILQGDLRQYTRYEIERGWPAQRNGIVSPEGGHRLSQFADDLLTFQPRQKSEEIVQAETFRELNGYIDERSARIANVTTGIPGVLWWVVGIGAAIFIALVAMLDMEIHVHLILASLLAVFLGLVIFLIAEMDMPFRGEISVSPGAFKEVYDSVMAPDDAVNRSMADLISLTGKLGPPRLQGRANALGRDVPGLFFGATEVNNNFDIVDRVVAETGGTATLFVKSDDEYVRVSTNIESSSGVRAVGSILDPDGPVIQKIRIGQAFYGETRILGFPYMTGYEPIKDASDNVIGIYYVGYRLRTLSPNPSR
jgi:hypothetical protein